MIPSTYGHRTAAILDTLRGGEMLTAAEIAKANGLTVRTVAALLHGLVNQGRVWREMRESAIDGRRAFVYAPKEPA